MADPSKVAQRGNMAKTTRRQTVKRQVDALEKTRTKLQQRVKKLTRDARTIRAAIQSEIEAAGIDNLRKWHASRIELSLVAGGDPGVLSVNCQLYTPTQVFNAMKEFQIINICFALPYMAPQTIGVWRDCLKTAIAILDKEIVPAP